MPHSSENFDGFWLYIFPELLFLSNNMLLGFTRWFLLNGMPFHAVVLAGSTTVILVGCKVVSVALAAIVDAFIRAA